MSNGYQFGEGYGTGDYTPTLEDIIQFQTPTDISEAFGLNPEDYNQYFTPFTSWKTDILDEELALGKEDLFADYTAKSEELGSQLELLGLQGEEAEDAMNLAFDTSLTQVSDQYANTMASMIDASANSLIGGASSRTARTMGQRSQEMAEKSGQTAAATYGATSERLALATSDIQKQQERLFGPDGIPGTADDEGSQYARDLLGMDLAHEKAVKSEQQRYLDDLMNTITMLDVETGAFDYEGLSADELIDKIHADDSHWEKQHLKSAGKNNVDFYKWFLSNHHLVDRGIIANDRDEIAAAYKDWDAGRDAGSSDAETYCCTAAMNTGYMSYYKISRLKVWHKNKSNIWQEGYDVWGKIIANNLVSKYKFAGESTEAFYQWKINKKKTFKGLIGILTIQPIAYLIGFIKSIKRGI